MVKISEKIDPKQLPSTRLRGFWVLDFLTTEQDDRFSAAQIANHLTEVVGIPTTRQAVFEAFKGQGQAAHKKKGKYKLMSDGREALGMEVVQKTPEAIIIEPGLPFSAKKTVGAILSSLSGEIKICDPYCGVGLLALVHGNIDKRSSIKVLTSQIVEKVTGSFAVALKDLQSEGYNISIRVYKKSVLHDRYVIDAAHFWFSGNSLNDIGKKESLLVSMGQDVRQSMNATFDARWKVGTEFI